MKRAWLLLLTVALLLLPARAEETLLWLHGDFDQVERDGFQQTDEGFFEYEKIASAGALTLYAAGYPVSSGYALTTPATAGEEGVDYETLDPVSVGGIPAERWRYGGDDGSGAVRWDFLAVKTEEMLLSILISAPDEDAAAYDADVDALIASLSLQGEAQDDAPMLTADFTGFDLAMDVIMGDDAAMGRMTARTLADGGAVSVTILRGQTDEVPYTSFEDMRGAFLMDAGAERVAIDAVCGADTERWRYTVTLENGGKCQTDAVLVRTRDYAYAAVIGLTGETSADTDAIVGHLISTLALDPWEAENNAD